MTLQLIDAEPRHPVRPPQAILIGGQNVGECEWKPCIGQGIWHASIHLNSGNVSRQTLFQGFGETPERAVMDAVATGRIERDAFAKSLAWLEEQLGTEGTELKAGSWMAKAAESEVPNV